MRFKINLAILALGLIMASNRAHSMGISIKNNYSTNISGTGSCKHPDSDTSGSVSLASCISINAPKTPISIGTIRFVGGSYKGSVKEEEAAAITFSLGKCVLLIGTGNVTTDNMISLAQCVALRKERHALYLNYDGAVILVR